jgi:DNA polymerase (family 10)
VATSLPRNDELADQLELLADLSELEGEDSFRVLAYRRAATRIRETGGPVAQLALEGKAKSLSGIGKTIEDKIVQVVELGEMEALTKRKLLVPEEVVKFMRLPGLGPKTARRIWKELGVTTLAELKEAAEQERLRALSGLGAKSEEKILKALAEEPQDPRDSRRLLGDGLPVLLSLVEELRAHPAAIKVSEAGSARRRRETFRDLDVIATSTDAPALIEHFTSRDNVASVVAKGDTKATVITNDGLRLDLRVVPPESYGNLLQHFTGSKEHNVALREDAVRRGYSVSEYSVTNVETGEEFKAADEEELYAHLGYAYIPPELRENGGELVAARNDELPKLVERGALRGDLHSHSTWSDGKATLEQMALAAQELGHEYLAMCDHSHRLRDGKLLQQWEEIDALNERLAPFRILKGIEVNIRANGEVDVADELLEPLDWVMASVHASFDNDPTGRVLSAMQNPHVDCIGHPTSRRIGVRNPSTIEIEKIVEGALETGTFLEINSQPDRLDLRDANARLAGEAGVTLVISSDAHSAKALRYVDLGVAQARRAWLTKDQILNTRSWAAIEKLRRGAGKR